MLRAVYTVLAPLYDWVVPRVSSRARTLGQSWLQVRDGESVLDLGTGTGLAFGALAAANPSGWTEGIDATPAMLTRARRRMKDCPHGRYRLRRGEAGTLPYAPDTFDAVFSSYVVDVLPSSRILPVLREVRRVLRDDGRLVLVYLAPPTAPIGRLWGALARRLPLLVGGARPVSLRSRLSRAGFSVEATAARTQLGLRSSVVRATPA